MKFKKILKTVLLIVLPVAALLAITAGIFAVRGAVMWNNAKKLSPVNSVAAEVRSRGDFTEYGKLPEFYIDAVIATEDRKFETHCGIDLKSIARALFYDIKSLSFEQGGSTITQQLAKNLWFTQEKTIDRKFAEVFAAFELEKSLSKQEIFELYANTIYFGSGCYGITAASREYFGKEPSALTESECAMLAGLPNAPSAYSPNESPELARQRMSIVLDSMTQTGRITSDKASEILAAA